MNPVPPGDPDTTDEEQPTSTGTTRRRRGTRGGRGRSGSARAATKDDTTAQAANGSAEPIDDHPQVAGRRKPRAATSKTTGARAKEPAAKEPTAEEPAAEEPKPKARARSRTTTRTAKSTEAAAAGATDSGTPQLDTLVAAITEMQRSIETLGKQVERATRRERLGVFVDVPNILYGAERVEDLVDMGRLLDLLSEGRDLVRATAYAPVSDNPAEPVQQQKFVAPFVKYAYRIVTKPLKRFQDGSIKGNFDVEMALDMVAMADRLDVACIVSGDADFAKAVEMMQERGVRVEVVAFAGSTSIEIRALADAFIEVGSVVDKVRPR